MIPPSKPPAAPDAAGADALETYRLFHDLPFIGMAIASPHSERWTQVNQTLCDMLGYTQQEMMQLTWRDVSHPEDLGADVALFQKSMTGELDSYTLDKRYLRKDGSIVHACIDVKAVRTSNGEVQYFVCTVADITARVMAEREVRRSAALLTKLSHQVPGVIYQFQLFPDGRSRFPFASESLRNMFEVEPSDVVEDAAPAFARVHPDDLATLNESIDVSARDRSEWRFSFRVQLPRLGERWLTGSARPEPMAQPDGSILWHGFIMDSTDEYRSREALRESEERFRIQVEHAPEAIVVYDVESRLFVDANDNAEELFGRSRAELLGCGVADVSPEHQADGRRTAVAMQAHLQATLAGKTPSFEFTHKHSSGREIPCELRLVAMPFAGRQLVRGSIIDITGRKKAIDSLHRMQSAIDSAINGVAMSDLDGRITYANKAVLDLWGFESRDQMIGRNIVSFWDSREETAMVGEAILTVGYWRGELSARHADGTKRRLQVNAGVFTDSSGVAAGMLASFVDVTEQRKLQAQLLQAQKMESVGRLAGGIAHDFNNLLTVMKGYIELSLATLDQSSSIREDLLEVDRAADSAAALTQQLLAFSRKQIIAPRVLDLNEIVRRVQSMLQRLLGEQIELEIALADELQHVRFDAGQAEQILVNLATNARDAMPNGGQLTIETENVTLDARYRRDHPDVIEGDYVLLAVSDSGTGMSRETREHAFEPFFTTKSVGRGTGLGLAMIQGAVDQNGGRIEVYSEAGHGTSFKIYLPSVSEDRSIELRRKKPSLPSGTETIVLAEDDETVRALAVRLLRNQGYHVYDFANGVDALEWLRQTDEHVHLLFTDVVMPEMNGKLLADEFLKLRPNVRVLYASGYTANVIVHHGVLKPGVQFLAKPFSIAALATRVREVLDAPRREAPATTNPR